MVKIVEDRSETAFEDISVESDGEKVRLKIEIQRVFVFMEGDVFWRKSEENMIY